MMLSVLTQMNGVRKLKKPRKRAIEKAEKELEKYKNWKELVLAVGGSIRKDQYGKCFGILHVD